jgi:tetratricopeptide (TPR) repeat protein
MQFLIGQDDRWLAEAEKWKETRSQRERAFLMVVMFNGSTLAAQAKAYKKFLASVQKRDSTTTLLRKLYLDSSRFPIAGTIPNSVRYILVDDALAKNDIDLATRLMIGLEQAPDDADAFEWGLRRARVVVLGGRADEGISVLNSLIDNMQTPDKQMIDRATQVVFDLQTVGQHEAAVSLFDKLNKLSVDPQLKRELLFWQADSYKAIGSWPRAAQLYLLSATVVDGKGYDFWGQTARFRAAEVLAEAGLVDDARRLYEGLLKATREPGRRAAINYKLQELWLKKPKD